MAITACHFILERDTGMKKGFTLLEMLVTIVVLTAGIVPVVQMMGMAMFADVNTENTVIAAYLAQEAMEEIKDAASYAAINGFAHAQTPMTGDYADFDKEVTVTGDPKQVNVIISWDAKGTEQGVDLVSLFADYDY